VQPTIAGTAFTSERPMISVWSERHCSQRSLTLVYNNLSDIRKLKVQKKGCSLVVLVYLMIINITNLIILIESHHLVASSMLIASSSPSHKCLSMALLACHEKTLQLEPVTSHVQSCCCTLSPLLLTGAGLRIPKEFLRLPGCLLGVTKADAHV
jgi:hypothetical protein